LRVIDDGRIGVPPIPRICKGIAAMTPTEMEEAIRNLQLQADRIEQFLPNLATRGELVAQIQDARRHAAILNEATRGEIKLLAENLARVEATMATKAELRAAIGGLEEQLRATMATKQDLKEAIGGLERTLSAQIGQLASQIANLAKRRRR
jgi:DNA repair exonuclease SbcCD ATPase subunit